MTPSCLLSTTLISSFLFRNQNSMSVSIFLGLNYISFTILNHFPSSELFRLQINNQEWKPLMKNNSIRCNLFRVWKVRILSIKYLNNAIGGNKTNVFIFFVLFLNALFLWLFNGSLITKSIGMKELFTVRRQKTFMYTSLVDLIVTCKFIVIIRSLDKWKQVTYIPFSCLVCNSWWYVSIRIICFV